MPLRIETDGSARNTRIFNAETGEDITAMLQCLYVTINIDPQDNTVTSDLVCSNVEFAGTLPDVHIHPLDTETPSQ